MAAFLARAWVCLRAEEPSFEAILTRALFEPRHGPHLAHQVGRFTDPSYCLDTAQPCLEGASERNRPLPPHLRRPGDGRAYLWNVLDPRTLQLYQQGARLPCMSPARMMAAWTTGIPWSSTALGLDNLYTDTNVYWLTYGSTAGRRMAVRDGMPGAAAIPPHFLPRFEWRKTSSIDRMRLALTTGSGRSSMPSRNRLSQVFTAPSAPWRPADRMARWASLFRSRL